MLVVRYSAVSLSGVFPLDASVTPAPQVTTIKNVSGHCHMSPGGGEGAELPLVDNLDAWSDAYVVIFLFM